MASCGATKTGTLAMPLHERLHDDGDAADGHREVRPPAVAPSRRREAEGRLAEVVDAPLAAPEAHAGRAAVQRVELLSDALPAWSNAVRNGDLGGVWLKSHRFLRCSEVLSISSWLHRAASSLQAASRASGGQLWRHQDATLTMLPCEYSGSTLLTEPDMKSSVGRACCAPVVLVLVPVAAPSPGVVASHDSSEAGGGVSLASCCCCGCCGCDSDSLGGDGGAATVKSTGTTTSFVGSKQRGSDRLYRRLAHALRSRPSRAARQRCSWPKKTIGSVYLDGHAESETRKWRLGRPLAGRPRPPRGL